MKKHAIIPIFISHRGCPNDCVFCNQKKITAREGDVTPEDVRSTIDQWLTTLHGVEKVEVSFYGGSFTGIPMDQQTAFLEIAKDYKDRGLIDMIHLSTRPDYIDCEILDNLKAHSVDVIELGVQSFSDEVLRLSGRGHDAACVYRACDLIKSYGFTLGIQLMIGLPGDSRDTCIQSALETVKIHPAIARIYPTVTIRGTELYRMMDRGQYQPLDLSEAVERAKEMYLILEGNGINVIRVGLKASEIMEDQIGFHPAFRQLMESEIARDSIEAQLAAMSYKGEPLSLLVRANSRSFSNIYGHKAMNSEYFQKKYPRLRLKGALDDDLSDEVYVLTPWEDPL
ncbi:MAG: radical SAM protein [Firmicutes bacterium]|nr:radical SAM protein [Bacillota bacterium]